MVLIHFNQYNRYKNIMLHELMVIDYIQLYYKSGLADNYSWLIISSPYDRVSIQVIEWKWNKLCLLYLDNQSIFSISITKTYYLNVSADSANLFYRICSLNFGSMFKLKLITTQVKGNYQTYVKTGQIIIIKFIKPQSSWYSKW